MQSKAAYFFLLAGLLVLFSGCRPPLPPFKQTAAPGAKVYFVPNDRKMVALTFDDGPNGAATEQILNALKERGVPASFFVIGSNAERFPQLVKRMTAEGHLVGNHSYKHSRFDQVPGAEIEKDISDGNNALEKIIGHKPFWFRPPYGINGVGLDEICRRQDLAIAGWSLDANDWNPHPVTELVEAIVSQVTGGDIILLHDGWETRENPDRRLAMAAVPVIIDQLKARGFVFVTLDELLRHAGAPYAVFENGMKLLGMKFSSDPVHPGQEFLVRYFWEVPAIPARDTPKAFVHFVTRRGNFSFQDDHVLPVCGDVRDMVVRSSVRVPRKAHTGRYNMKLGLFYPAKPEKENRLRVQTAFPQSRREISLPAVLEVVPAAGKTK
jgi:peptidoglycan/xylan/chitin deacetylase (PgdA/CDA1 family)